MLEIDGLVPGSSDTKTKLRKADVSTLHAGDPVPEQGLGSRYQGFEVVTGDDGKQVLEAKGLKDKELNLRRSHNDLI